MSAIWFQKTDVARLVAKSVAIETEFSISDLPRVGAVVLTGSGPVQADFEFKNARQGIVLADGALSGCVKLRCQRCLDEMDFTIDSQMRLALLTLENQREFVPADYEPLMIADGSIRLVDLIEDEILLLLPIAAKHNENDCGPLNENLKSLNGPAETETIAPFANLAEMMRDGND